MATNNNETLSDVNLEIDASQLSDISSKWSNNVINAGLSSLNIKGAFSSLIGQGVGSSYIESLENAIKKVEQYALNISQLIGSFAESQDVADKKSADNSNQNGYDTFVRTGGNNTQIDGNYNTGEYGDKDKANADIENTSETELQGLTNEETIKVVDEFISIFNGNLYDAAFNKDFASKLKEQLLASPNIAEDTKKVLVGMDPNIIQTGLQNILLSGKTITDFSKLILSIFNQNLTKGNQKLSLFDVSENISVLYSKLSTEEDFQKELYKVYSGEAPSNEVNDETVYFTRDLVDTLAAASGTSFEDVLTNQKYGEVIGLAIKDVSDAFAVLRGAKDMDSTVTSKLYSSIIVKQEGNGIRG